MKIAKPKVVLFLGGPGSGKGTQSSLIVDKFRFIHLSAGELLRNEIQRGSKNGELLNSLIKEGKIVPSEITVGLLKDEMKRKGWEQSKFLIDGFPRNEENMNAWEKEMKQHIDFKFLLFLSCKEETLLKRIRQRGLNSGRNDDNEESFVKRMVTFNTETSFVINYYKSINKAFEVNGEGGIDKVFARIMDLFKNIDD